MDDLDRLVAVDAAETAAAASSSGAAASAVSSTQTDPGSKNGQYRLFAMVSHLGKNTSSGAPPPPPPRPLPPSRSLVTADAFQATTSRTS
jgi:hypothetical protein